MALTEEEKNSLEYLKDMDRKVRRFTVLTLHRKTYMAALNELAAVQINLYRALQLTDIRTSHVQKESIKDMLVQIKKSIAFLAASNVSANPFGFHLSRGFGLVVAFILGAFIGSFFF